MNIPLFHLTSKRRMLRSLVLLFIIFSTVLAFLSASTVYAASIPEKTLTLTPNTDISIKNNKSQTKVICYKLELKSNANVTFRASSYSKKAQYSIVPEEKPVLSSGKLSSLINKQLTLKKGTYLIKFKLKSKQYAKKLYYTAAYEDGKKTEKDITLSIGHKEDLSRILKSAGKDTKWISDQKGFVELNGSIVTAIKNNTVSTVTAYLKNGDTAVFTISTVFIPETVTIRDTKYRTDATELSCNVSNDSEQLLKFIYLKDLNVHDLKDPYVLQNMTELRKLRIFDSGCVITKNTSYLQNLTNLENLELLQTGTKDLSFLKHLTKMKRIMFYNEDLFSDLTPLKNLKNLKVLIFSGLGTSYSDLNDISPLSGLNSLEKLDISYTNVTDISPLYGLSSLEQISIENLEDKLDADTTIRVLKSMNKLERVMVDTDTELGKAIESSLPYCNVSEYDFFDSWD